MTSLCTEPACCCWGKSTHLDVPFDIGTTKAGPKVTPYLAHHKSDVASIAIWGWHLMRPPLHARWETICALITVPAVPADKSRAIRVWVAHGPGSACMQNVHWEGNPPPIAAAEARLHCLFPLPHSTRRAAAASPQLSAQQQRQAAAYHLLALFLLSWALGEAAWQDQWQQSTCATAQLAWKLQQHEANMTPLVALALCQFCACIFWC